MQEARQQDGRSRDEPNGMTTPERIAQAYQSVVSRYAPEAFARLRLAQIVELVEAELQLPTPCEQKQHEPAG